MKKINLIFCFFISYGAVAASSSLNLEFGIVENSYNKVKIPGDDGTKFNIRRSLPESNPYFRLDYKKAFDNKHGVRLLYAPLKLKGDHRYSKDIEFNGETFSRNSETKTLYQFNSYRISYFYQWFNTEKFKLNVGITGKVRDANIKLKQGDTKKNRYDLGFVPLLYVWSEYWISDKMKFTFDFDGLAAPQGRAFDLALMFGHRISSNLTANLGYRMLEGGVDNDKVYNFSQFNFYFASLEYEF